MGKSLRTAATSYIDVHLAVLYFDWIDPGRDHRGHPGHRAGLQMESRAVLRALDLQVEQLTAAEQEVLVRAHVVDRVEVAVLSVGQADLGVSRDHALEAAHGQLGGRGYADPSQGATPARSRSSCAPARTGYGRAPGRRSPERSSAWRSSPGCRASADRKGGSGRQDRPSRRECSARRCCRSPASGWTWPSPWPKEPGCGSP